MTVTITAAELAEELASDNPPALLDVRWYLNGPSGYEEYLEGHLPGAVFVDLDTELSAPPEERTPGGGRHPLPQVSRLQESMRRWGLHEGQAVVAYDGRGNLASARAWWLLRWAGVENVRLLDGALPAWTAAGHALATGDVTPEPGDAWARAGTLPTLDLDGARDFEGLLLDARAPERFRGESEPLDPKAGHIPGAVNLPSTDNLADDGRFLPAEALRRRFTDLGLDQQIPMGTYCGSGVTAAHLLAALTIAGYDATLYPGSWSQWSNTDQPVATGE